MIHIRTKGEVVTVKHEPSNDFLLTIPILFGIYFIFLGKGLPLGSLVCFVSLSLGELVSTFCMNGREDANVAGRCLHEGKEWCQCDGVSV